MSYLREGVAVGFDIRQLHLPIKCFCSAVILPRFTKRKVKSSGSHYLYSPRWCFWPGSLKCFLALSLSLSLSRSLALSLSLCLSLALWQPGPQILRRQTSEGDQIIFFASPVLHPALRLRPLFCTQPRRAQCSVLSANRHFMGPIPHKSGPLNRRFVLSRRAGGGACGQLSDQCVPVCGHEMLYQPSRQAQSDESMRVLSLSMGMGL